MADRRPGSRAAAYAMCEGVARPSGTQAIGVVVRDARHQRLLSLSELAPGGVAERARLAAIAAALRAGRQLAIDRLTVYCHDRSVVDWITRREPVPPELLAGCLEVRALMNMYRRAEVAFVPWPKNLEAVWLARQAASRPLPEVAGHVQPALPLTG
jgi:ribonuclease HI